MPLLQYSSYKTDHIIGRDIHFYAKREYIHSVRSLEDRRTLSRFRRWYKLRAITYTATNEILEYVVTEPYFGDSLALKRLTDIALKNGHELSRYWRMWRTTARNTGIP
ncbi:MAG: hypothetical protein WCS17_10400 [Prevotella sp.]